MDHNNLYSVALSDLPDEEILNRFVNAELPGHVYQDFYAFLAVSRNYPIAIRSSSKLEDSHYQPFAGIYSTYMIPRFLIIKRWSKMLSDAIKEVYASVYYKASKAYMTATANVIDEEKMGIILQEVCGNRHGDILLSDYFRCGTINKLLSHWIRKSGRWHSEYCFWSWETDC